MTKEIARKRAPKIQYSEKGLRNIRVFSFFSTSFFVFFFFFCSSLRCSWGFLLFLSSFVRYLLRFPFVIPMFSCSSLRCSFVPSFFRVFSCLSFRFFSSFLFDVALLFNHCLCVCSSPRRCLRIFLFSCSLFVYYLALPAAVRVYFALCCNNLRCIIYCRSTQVGRVAQPHEKRRKYDRQSEKRERISESVAVSRNRINVAAE